MFTIIFLAVWIPVTIGVPYILRKRGVQEGQMIATGFGILGTFVGIVVGLINFDVTNIEQSVPGLLDGLRFAFITSIVGMGYSMLIGTLSKQLGFESVEVAAKDKSESELLAEMLEEIKVLNKNITGDNDSTVITQIQKLRTSVNDKQDELKKAFDEFAKQMAENNMKALIQAINKVMEDFNTKINDQLGQSFRELSESVKNLVEWQKDYKVLIELATKTLQTAQESLKNSSESLHNTSEKVSEIAESNKKIEELNRTFESVVGKLNQMLESTVNFSQEMKVLSGELNGSGEIIKREIKSIVEESVKSIKTHASDISENINALAENSIRAMHERNNESLQSLEETTRKVLSNFGQHMASISLKLGTDFAKIQSLLSQSDRVR